MATLRRPGSAGILVALLGVLAAAPHASAAQNMDALISYTVTPDPWTDQMQGQTAKVTVTGKTDAQVPLALLSYKTTGPTVGPLHIGPQALNDIDRVVLDGRETRTLQVDIPDCFYQVDFIDATDLTDKEIQVAQFSHGWIKAVVGGNVRCHYSSPLDPTPDPTPTPDPDPDPNPAPSPSTVPNLTPVSQGGPVTATSAAVNVQTVGATMRACTAVSARGYRVRARQRNTITVRVKTSAKVRPTVRLRGAGVRASKKVSASGTATFSVRPSRAGAIRVTASGCVKVASVRVAVAKKAQRSGSAPSFTG